ncbi:hypothetical protein FHR83_005547 [Actinoplanes campanulatus]|uniref:Uncharacterized protein n=1 Tax=Actinoplanes campanulatus TaxID=113559 RepID=A0A7W5AKA9_9ACTN|nr:hypothetical protein [Actinoplanes campanulatus]MBB3097863.1 hypothetical protein [Actinoplanes campanulatus]GGN22381.1 hypothetical protein GCM10010109_36940 [Actinoplanes campanulatus]GID34554.1 hypothetical protein Aca09nite_10600 [Actinoplanes campanulatus]
MSSIASLHIVKLGDLPAIVSAAGQERVWEAIQHSGRETGEEYGWSGYVMLNILDNLDVTLENPDLHESAEAISADFGHTTLITSNAKEFLDRLDPAAHEIDDLLDGPIDLQLDAEESRHAVEDTLSLLREAIAGLADDELLLLTIG